ncbi:MAG: MiaB/RimO family radical SAM methylthiotransferase [Acidimicrobiia bacterium]|nr:MiaB/RimO family radical SAM methylthiotransferase [Acidimicrobiia bacterium]
MTDARGGQVRLLTLGCRLNQAESDETLRALRDAGIRVAGAGTAPPEGRPGDVVVVNTCTVTSDASKSSRKLVRRAAESGARVVVTGCYAVAAPEVCAELPGVVAVVANKDKDDLAATVAGLGGLAPSTSAAAVASPAQPVRQAFKVQTGCDEGCTFCIIPTTRGDLTSRGADAVIAGVQAQVDAGAGEIALTGVHLGKYGIDTAGTAQLATLVRRILAEVDGLVWLRLSSIECGWIDDDLLAAMDDPRVCPHLHVPLQAGCDATLAAMGRPYDTQGFRAAAERVRSALGPDAGLSTDVLVGFPGESDAHFDETAAFVEEIAFTKLHVFRYSPRPGTPAAAHTEPVPEDVKKDRSSRLRSIGDRLTTDFGRRFVGRELAVMIERAGRAERAGSAHVRPTLMGTAGNYLKVTTAGPAGLVGDVVTVSVESASAGGVSGTTSLAGRAQAAAP